MSHNWMRDHDSRVPPPNVPPPNYRCNRCHQHGHFIHDCPQNTIRPDLKRTTGIPRSFLEPVKVDHASVSSAKVNPQGLMMVNRREQEVFQDTRSQVEKELDDMGIENSLVVQSMNYHGQNLTNFLKDLPEFRNLDLSKVDYYLYQRRTKELRQEDRGRRLLVHRFITQNFNSLFKKPQPRNATSEMENGHKNVEENSTALIPPIETFMKIDADDRSTHFFDMVMPFDILLCRITAKNSKGFLMRVLGFAPQNGKSRYIRDVGIKCFCPSDEVLPNQVRPYDVQDLVCVIVLEVKKETQRLCVGMKIESITNEVLQQKVRNYKIPLGSVSDQDIPKLFDDTEMVLDRKLPYWEVLEKSPGFANPSNVDVLCEELGLSKTTGDTSLFPSLQFKYDESRKAPALRKLQTSRVAFKHVAEGIKHYKNGDTVEAFSCLNHALKVDPENVEGLVARGALYANNGKLETAIKDFEEALKHNSQHKNAIKYLCETLTECAKNYEENDKEDEAVKTYEKILVIDPDNRVANSAIDRIKSLERDAKSLGIDLKSFKKNPEMLAKFKEFIKSENEKKMKPVSPDFRRQRTRSRSPSPPNRKARKLSPLSQRLSLVNPQALLAPEAAVSNLGPNVHGVDPIIASKPNLPPPGLVPPGEEPMARFASAMPFYPAGPSLGTRPPPAKSARDLEYEKAVESFLKKNEKKPMVDSKYDHDAPKRKRKTFTDYPVYDESSKNPSSSRSSNNEDERVTARKSSVEPPSNAPKVEYDSRLGLYRKVSAQEPIPERIVREVISKSPSPPPVKKQRSRSPRKSRSRSRDRSSKPKEKRRSLTTRYGGSRSRSRSRSRDRHRRSRSRDHHRRSRSRDRKRSRSRERSRKRSRSRDRKRSRSRDRSRRSKSKEKRKDDKPGNYEIKDLQSETEKIRAQRLQIEKEKQAILNKIHPAGSSSSSGISSNKKEVTSRSLHMNLPMPVPNASLPGLPKPVGKSGPTGSIQRKERKEISMTLKGNSKVDTGKQWEVEDDDEEDEINEALESVRKAVDTDGSRKASSNRIDPNTAGKILPGARNFEDIEKYLKRTQQERKEQLKNINRW